MKAKTIYTDEYGGVVSCDDFDILQRSHDDLLEALEGLQDMLNNHYGDDSEETHLIDKAFDAIKKARGL